MSRPVLLIIGVCFLTFFAGLGRPAITDSDEAFYAESAREIVESGDWLTPRFNYVPRFEKPILYYWLVALTYQITGVEVAAARLPSALAGIGLSILVFMMARRSFGVPTGTLAGIITATSFGYVAVARLALPDLVLAFLVTLSIWSTIVACLNQSNEHGRSLSTRERGRYLLVAALATGGAVLTKGPVGIVLPALVIGPIFAYEIWTSRSDWLVRRSDVALAVLLFLVVTIPWFLGMTLTHGLSYLDRFFVAENVERFTTSRYNDPRALWYYIPIVAGGFLPWSPFMILWLPQIAAVLRRRTRPTQCQLRLIWWASAPLLFFTLSIGKQPRYILAILPPLAILLAHTLHHHLQNATNLDRRFLRCSAFIGGFFIVFGGLIFHVRALFLEWSPNWTNGVALTVAMSGVAILFATWSRRAIIHTVATATITAVLGIYYILLATPTISPVERVARMISTAQASGELYGRYRVFNRNLVFYSQQPFVELSALDAARNFLLSPERVLCVLFEEDAALLEDQGLSLRRLGETRYVNTGTLNLRTILDPDPSTSIRSVVLVSNR